MVAWYKPRATVRNRGRVAQSQAYASRERALSRHGARPRNGRAAASPVTSSLTGCGWRLAAGRYESGSEWPSYNGGYNATRFSSLSEINTENVASITEVARFNLPEITSFQSGPVLIDGTMYVTTATNTYALDARTGE